MGAFDDLIPAPPSSEGGGGAFDDLIPRKREPAPNAGQSRFEDVGPAQAGYEGFLSGITGNLRDEAYGLSEASGLPGFLGGFRAPVGAARLMLGSEGAQQAYEQARDEKRRIQQAAQEQEPGMYATGQVGGAVALPVGKVLQAPSMAGRALRAAGVGGAYGAVSGFGEGEGAADSATRAASGGAMGALLGGATTPIIEKGAQAIGAAARAPINMARSYFNPTGQAERAIGGALQQAERADPNAVARLTQAQLTGQGPGMAMDVLGAPGQRLARSARNLSGEADTTLTQALNDRAEQQAPRVTAWIDSKFNFPDAAREQVALQTARRGANSAAYEKAYQEGAAGIWSPELERLAGDKNVANAMRKAADEAGTEAIINGGGAMNPRISFTPDGRMKFNRGPSGVPTYPDLQYWDLVRRELSSAAQSAGRGTEDHRRLSALASKMNDALDAAVPSYQAARKTAAGFFGARDALEAGQNFLGQRVNIQEAAAAFGKMSPNEQKLFRDGFLSRLKEQIASVRDSRNLMNAIPDSPAMRNKLLMVLGKQGAAEFQALRMAENIMQSGLTAVKGNSTTAMQLIGAGAAGAAGGEYAFDSPSLTGAAAMVAVASKRGLDQRVAREVARLLTSKDAAVLQRGIKAIAQSPRHMAVLRSLNSVAARIGGQNSPKGLGAQLAGTGRAEDE